MSVPIWNGIVSSPERWGVGWFDLDRPQDFRRYLRDLVGTRVAIVVRKYKPPRSVQANRRYWALLTVAARELGYDDVEELHEGIAMKLLPLPELVPGVPRRRRTPSLNTSQFADYCDAVERFLIMDLHVDLTGWQDEAERR